MRLEFKCYVSVTTNSHLGPQSLFDLRITRSTEKLLLSGLTTASGHIRYLDFSTWEFSSVEFSRSVQFNCSVVSKLLWPPEPQHARPPCPSPTPRVYSNSCPSSRWCHPTISSSAVPFSSCLQTFTASRSFQMSQFFTSDGQSTGASTSAPVLSMNIQDWFI